MDFMTNPKHKLTLGSTPYECEILLNAKVIRRENGFDIATLMLDNEGWTYPDVVVAGTAVQLEVANEGESYPTNPMFKGIARFPISNIEKNRTVTLSCLGSGRGLMKMLVGYEYGAQSINPTLDTITEMLTNATHGIIPRYVNRILEAGAEGDSGFLYDVTDVDAINDVINYVDFPYKPADKSINDLVDIVTALKAGSAGPHWIVTTDDHFRLKLLTSTQAGEWDKYYGASQANATLTYEEDYELLNLEELAAEGNYIIYYGKWRKPSNGDFWTENQSALWSAMDADSTVSDDNVSPVVNTWSVRCVRNNAVGSVTGMWFPAARNAAWDFSGFTDFNVPTLNFYIRRDCSGGAWSNFYVYLETALGGGVFGYGYTDLTSDVSEDFKWYHFSLPLGPYYNVPERYANFKWYGDGNLNWAQVDDIRFRFQCNKDDDIKVDGLYFGDAPICRVAWNSDLPGGTAEMCLIVDDIGKDDSLIATDDSGIMAQLAYAELLRQQKATYLTTVKCDMLPEALPGQWFYLQEDSRATQIIQEIKGDSYTSTIHLTDDLTNGRSRVRYEDLNKQYANLRPEFQDRQATNIKAGTVDWRITRLVKDYA